MCEIEQVSMGGVFDTCLGYVFVLHSTGVWDFLWLVVEQKRKSSRWIDTTIACLWCFTPRGERSSTTLPCFLLCLAQNVRMSSIATASLTTCRHRSVQRHLAACMQMYTCARERKRVCTNKREQEQEKKEARVEFDMLV